MNILAAVDFSAVTDGILTTLDRIARTMPAKVYLVHVAPPDPDFVGYDVGPKAVRGQVAAEHRARHQQLQELADGLRKGGVEATALLLQGATVDALLAEAQKLAADLIVLGSHGRGAVHKLLVGSVAEGVVRGSTVPVLLVPARQVSGT
jgi:nucleotide-binding universal stress UspA family protein